MKIFILFIIAFLASMSSLMAQSISSNTNNFEAAQAYMTEGKLDGKSIIKVEMDSTVKLYDEPTFIKVKNIEFKDGTIEVNVLSKFLPNAPDWARGFIGVTFRINSDNSKFDISLLM